MTTFIIPHLCFSDINNAFVNDEFLTYAVRDTLNFSFLSSAKLPDLLGKINEDPNSGFYYKKNSYGNMIYYANTEHGRVVHFRKNMGQMPKGGRCDYCKRDYADQGVGIPLIYKEMTELIDGEYVKTHVFWVEGQHCSYEHALGVLKRNVEYASDELDKLIRIMFRLQYGQDAVLEPPNAVALLDTEYGSMSYEQWNYPSHQYNPTGNVICAPVTREFIQHHRNKNSKMG